MPSVFGVYRGVYSSLVDDPDFQTLPPEARHVLLTMRISRDVGPGCIWRAYINPIAKRTGYTERVVERALKVLTASGWIEWDGAIIWIKNGLRYDPTFKISDEKHKKAVLKALMGLPKREIVLRVCDYYEITRPFEAPSKTLPGLCPPNPNPNPNPNPISEPEPEPEQELSGRGNGRDLSCFEDLWALHPGPKGPKAKALEVFKRVHPPEDVVALFERQIQRKAEFDALGLFHPNFQHLHRWLTNRRWTDDLPVLPKGKESAAARIWREAEAEERRANGDERRGAHDDVPLLRGRTGRTVQDARPVPADPARSEPPGTGLPAPDGGRA